MAYDNMAHGAEKLHTQIFAMRHWRTPDSSQNYPCQAITAKAVPQRRYPCFVTYEYSY